MTEISEITKLPYYEEKSDLEYTSVNEEVYGEIVKDVNGALSADSTYKYPIYEKSGDFDKSNSDLTVIDGYYYYLRPFPVEGVYVLEIYRRNDEYKELEAQISNYKEMFERGGEVEKTYIEKRNNIVNKKDVRGKSLLDWNKQFIESRDYLIEHLTNSSDYLESVDKSNNIDAFNEKQNVLNDESATQEQKDAAIKKYNDTVTEYHNKLLNFKTKLDLYSTYLSLYNVMFTDVNHVVPNTDTEAVENQKQQYKKIESEFKDDCLFLIKCSSPLIWVAELKDVSPGKLTDFSGSRSNVQSGVSNLYDVDTKFYDQKINAEKERPKYEEAKKKIEKYGASSKDKKFLAYKFINRKEDLADSYGLYREVSIQGDSYSIEVNSKQSIGNQIKKSLGVVNNKKFDTSWVIPNRYFIGFEKLASGTPVFTVSSCDDDIANVILKYEYRGNNSSPTIVDTKSSYDTEGCDSTKRFRTTFQFFSETKSYRTTTTDSKGSLQDSVRYNLFDAVEPYPVVDKVEVKQITKKQWQELPAKERLKYHKIGTPTMDERLQEILGALDDVKPIISSLMPVQQIMGSLQPFVGVLESTKSTIDTVKTTIGTVKSTIDKIASMPIVGVVASPLQSILDIITNLAGVFAQFYMQNYELIKKIRDIKEAIDPENIKKKLKEVKEVIDANIDKIKAEREKMKALKKNGSLEDIDKKKMNVESPIKENDLVKGSGAGLFADFNAKALIPAIPDEILEQIEQIKTTIDSFETLADTVNTMKELGDSVDQAMTTISTVKAVLTGTPPLEMVMDNIRTAARPSLEAASLQIQDFDKKQIALAEAAKASRDNALKYEIKETVPIETPFPEAVDEQTIKARTSPKIEG